MTREEAISVLKNVAWLGTDKKVGEVEKAVMMAVDALKAHGTCEDAVSRQTLQKELALYLIDDVTSEDEAGYNRAINDVQKMVLHLPSAQPEKAQLSGENATFDCISRQTAIDAIDDIESEVADGFGFQYEKWRKHFADLPSAQPERAEGHWFDATIGDLPVQVCDQCNTFFPLAYTGGGHHFCPNCGADMRGEQDED